jgi:putative ABC transport system permease protein
MSPLAISALNRKLLRELSRLKGQIITIALVLASGIACFLSMRGTYESLESARQAYYDRCRFAHVFARVERAPEPVGRRIESLPGVAVAQTRIVKDISLPLEGLDRPAYGQVLSLPASGDPATNAIRLESGRLPLAGQDDEIVLLKTFADAYGLGPGHVVPVVLNRVLRRLRVVGVAQSPEFVYAIRPGALTHDPRRYAAIWMPRQVVATAFDLEGAFDEISLRLQPGASEAEVLAGVDRILTPYGTSGAIARKDQSSHRILTGELSQLGALAAMVPLVFLGVAAFLINMVLARLIALQRPEIAVLKAVGYTNREVGLHYLGLVGVILAPAALLGVAAGSGLGRVVLALYQGIFRFPDLTFRLTAGMVATALLCSGGAALAGAGWAVRAAVRLPPAEAMRPPAPARYRRGLIERLRLGALLGAGGTMVMREIERRPLRTMLSSIGIAGAVSLIILGHFGTDSLSNYLEAFFRREQRQDLAVAFDRPVDPRAVEELARVPGVLRAEGLRAIPIRVRHDQRSRDSVLMGLASDAELRRLVARGGHEVAVPEDGVLVTTELGKILGVRPGDRLDVEVLEGDRRRVRPAVAGFVDEAVGLQLYALAGTVARLEGDLGAVSSVLLSVDPPALAGVEDWLRRSPRVIDVSDVSADVQRLRDMNGAAMDVWTLVSVTLAAAVIFGVVYNNARIALATRSRELASLRVLGLSRAEISSILIAGLAVEVSLAVPLGLYVGHQWAVFFFTHAVDRETFRFQVLIEGRTYLLAAAVAAVAAAASALWVRRSVDRLDLIGVLKTRE